MEKYGSRTEGPGKETGVGGEGGRAKVGGIRLSAPAVVAVTCVPYRNFFIAFNNIIISAERTTIRCAKAFR